MTNKGVAHMVCNHFKGDMMMSQFRSTPQFEYIRDSIASGKPPIKRILKYVCKHGIKPKIEIDKRGRTYSDNLIHMSRQLVTLLRTKLHKPNNQ